MFKKILIANRGDDAAGGVAVEGNFANAKLAVTKLHGTHRVLGD